MFSCFFSQNVYKRFRWDGLEGLEKYIKECSIKQHGGTLQIIIHEMFYMYKYVLWNHLIDMEKLNEDFIVTYFNKLFIVLITLFLVYSNIYIFPDNFQKKRNWFIMESVRD